MSGRTGGVGTDKRGLCINLGVAGSRAVAVQAQYCFLVKCSRPIRSPSCAPQVRHILHSSCPHWKSRQISIAPAPLYIKPSLNPLHIQGSAHPAGLAARPPAVYDWQRRGDRYKLLSYTSAGLGSATTQGLLLLLLCPSIRHCLGLCL